MSIRLRKKHQADTRLELRDQLIYELYIRLRAERETREAIVEAVGAGACVEVVEALATDPVPPTNDLAQADLVASLLRRICDVECRNVASIIDV